MELKDTIRDSISISLLKTRPIEDVFKEVKQRGAIIVMKDDVPECVLISPQEYNRIMDELEIARLEKDLSEEIRYEDLLNETDITELDNINN